MNKFSKKLGMTPKQWLKLVKTLKETDHKTSGMGNQLTFKDFGIK